jgi:membrane protein required for colicin V production
VNIVDLILLVVLFLFALRGYFKGLFRETLSLAGLVIGFLAAARYSASLATMGEGYWKTSPLILKGVSFVGVFFVVYFFFNLVGWLLHRSEKVLFLQTLNRAGGIAVGLAKGAAVMALAVSFAGSVNWVPKAAKDKFESSVLVPPLSQLGDGMVRIGKEKILTKELRQT